MNNNFKPEEFAKMFENMNENGNGPVLDNTVKAGIEKLQQTIKGAKDSENKSELIQQAVVEMIQSMGLNIPENVVEQIKNSTRGEK